MRSIWRTLAPTLRRDLFALAGAVLVVGTSYGAIAVASGLPWWVPSLSSVLVFAGGSQFLVVGVVAAGGGLVAAVLGALVLNARHLPFGLAIGDTVGDSRLRKLVGSHLMIDESVAFALAQDRADRRRAAYWLTGCALFVCWNTGTVVGALVGSAAGDPAALGLDAAFPAGLLALLLPSLKDPAARRVAIVGAVLAVGLTPLLPAGLPILLALLGLAALGRSWFGDQRWTVGPAPDAAVRETP